MTQKGGNLFLLFCSSLGKYGLPSWLSIQPEKQTLLRARMERKFSGSACQIKETKQIGMKD